MCLCVALLDEEVCDCQVPCSQTKFNAEVSYSKFPDEGTAKALISNGYFENARYQR